MALLLHLHPVSSAFLPSNPSSPISLPSPLTRTSFSRCIGLRICLPAKVYPLSHPRISGARSFSRIFCEKQQGTIPNVDAVTEQTWGKLVLESEIPVLVDFWAPWCGPCRMIAPVVSELAKEYAGRVSCLLLNTDESPNIAAEYGVRSIPTIMIFKRGEKKDTIIGAVPKNTLKSNIEKFLDS